MIALSPLEGLYHASLGIRFDFWTRREHFSLIESKPYANAFHPSDGPELAPFFHPDMWRRAALPPFFEKASEILHFGQEGSRVLAKRLSTRTKSTVHWIQSFPQAARGAVHASLFIAGQLRESGYAVADGVAPIDAAPADRKAVREWLAANGFAGDAGRPVLVHPGSGGRRKIWPLAKWWGLIRLLRIEKRLPVLMILGPADDHLDGLAGASRELGVRLIVDQGLCRLSAFLAEGRLYVGNDSGVSHLAAAVGVPSVIFFGPTDPRVWAPRGTNVRIVATGWDTSTNLTWTPVSTEPLEDEVNSVLSEFLA